MPKKKNASSLISELKRKTRRKYSSEEKIRIIIVYLLDTDSIIND
jgi:transposase-like protein